MKKKSASRRTSVDRKELCGFLAETLGIAAINDYSCNGLQVQGASQLQRVGLAVDACMDTFSLAVHHACQLLLVHHGIIWGGLTGITGAVHTQVRYLIEHDLNLFAAHLPLDCHPTLGNNAQLAAMIGLQRLKPFGLYKGCTIGFEGTLARAVSRDALAGKLSRALGAPCTVLPFGKEPIRRIAVVSGGGGDELAEAIEKGIDCFITGEPSHKNYHAAREAKTTVIYAGHYYTEKCGVQAVGRLVEKTFGIETMFLDVPTVI